MNKNIRPTNQLTREWGLMEVKEKAVHPPVTITTQEKYYEWLQQQQQKPVKR